MRKSGKPFSACVEPDTAASAGSDSSAKTSAAANPPPPPPTPPGYCDKTQSVWTTFRRNACQISHGFIWVYSNDTGATVGTLEFDMTDWTILENKPTWNNYAEINPTLVEGYAAGTTVVGQAACEYTSVCQLSNAQSLAPALMTQGQINKGHSIVGGYSQTTGSRGEARLLTTYQFTNDTWANPTYLTWNTPTVRCDQDVPGKPKFFGCVHTDFVPTMVYYTSGPLGLPAFANHVSQALASGLPGGTGGPSAPNTAPLSRLYDPLLNKKNSNTACAQAPKGTGLDCDEYPFKSTSQGAWTQTGGPPLNSPRTWPGCGITLKAPDSTGSKGWSICMIDPNQNQVAGSKLNSFFTDQRVLNQDNFRVLIAA